MADYETSSPDEDTSEVFEERMTAMKASWKAALKRNKKLLLKCPNYDRCGFKCGSVGGMTYHFVRCGGKPPEFKCAHCSRSYESRTGLNYHMASFHSSDSNPEDLKNDTSARPQRSAALMTMTAIHIANNLPPLKQTYHKPPSSHKTSPQSSTHNTTPPKKASTIPMSGRNKTPPTTMSKGNHSQISPSIAAHKNLSSPTLKTTPPGKTTPPSAILNLSEQQLLSVQPTILLPKKKVTPPPPLPLQMITEPLIISPKKSPVLSPPLKHLIKPQQKLDGTDKGKKGRYITIPSIEYPDKYKSYLPLWRQEMKMNAIVKCPNFKECEFKCTTVNGMKYHFVRCMKTNPPEFNCELCEKHFQCRTGLVWHLKKTHKMIDIQPSKSGYKGTLPIELKFDSDLEDEDDEHLMEAFQLPAAISPVRKKIKLEEPWMRRRRTGDSLSGFTADGEDSALESSAQSGSDGDDERDTSCDDKPSSGRRRLRKCSFPRRTADIFLQNLIFSRVPPKPRLGPETTKFNVPSVEFSIYDEIATDVDPKPSTILSLGVEALEWQKMYSDSESESDYAPEYDETGRAINYQSNSSVSDSDEEFMCSLTRKKTTSQRGGRPRGGGAGGGVGRGRRGRGAKVTELSHKVDVPMLVKPPEDLSYGSLLEPGIQPPPILIKHQVHDLGGGVAREDRKSAELQVTRLPSVPALVKAADRERTGGRDSSDIEEFDRLTNIGVIPVQPSIHPPHHIQPPPSLVMPSSAVASPASSLGHHSSTGSQRRREPPPLVRNTDNKQTISNSKVELQDTAHPKIIRLSSSEAAAQQRRGASASGASQNSLSYTIVTQAPQTSYSIVTQQSHAQAHRGSQNASATASLSSVDARATQPTQPTKPRRPGRPRKDQSVTLSTGLRTSAKTVRLGGGKSQQRSAGRSTRGGHTPSQVNKKSMKMTQYEFENVSYQSSLGHPQALQAQPAHQPQLFQVNSGSGGAQNLQSLVTPLQIIPAGSIPGYGMSGGGMILMQGAPQGVTFAAPPNSHDASGGTIFTQGGNTYQLVQAPLLTTDQGDNAQKVSVIMHPTAGVTPVQYIAQFDGPPPPIKRGRGRPRKEIKKMFEEERRKEQVKLDGFADTSQEHSQTSVSKASRTASSSSESMMSNVLQEYFKTEESRRTKTRAAGASPRGRGKRAAARGRQPLPATNRPNNSTEADQDGSPMEEGEEEESAQVEGRRSKSKRKTVLGKRRSTRGRVRQNEEEVANEEGDPLTSTPPSKLPKCELEEETVEEGSATPIPTEEEDQSLTMETESTTPATRGRRGRGRGRGSSKKSKQHSCSDCGREYSSYGGLQNHRRTAHHEGQVQLTASSTLPECMTEWRVRIKRQKHAFCPKCSTYRGSSVSSLKYHWERCGKTQEELAIFCPQCNKVFTTTGGLNYHLKYAHREEEPAPPTEPGTSTDEVPTPTPERRAARVAAERLTEITKSIGVQASPSSLSVEERPRPISYLSKDVFGFTAEEMTLFRLKVERDHSIDCPVEGCKRTFTTYPGLRYHLKHHGTTTSMKCPQCRRVLAGRKRMENHLKSKHPEIDMEIMNWDDCEYHPGDEEDSDGDELADDWDAEKVTKRTPKSSRNRTTLLIADAPVTLRQYQKNLKEKVEQLFSHGPSETPEEGEDEGEWEEPPSSHPMTEDWVRVEESDLSSYLPTTKQSMSYSFEGDDSRDSTLPLFGATESSDVAAVFFAGGPVWASDWLSVAEDYTGEQHVVLTAYRDLDETFPVETPRSAKGLLQVWSSGDLSMSEEPAPPPSPEGNLPREAAAPPLKRTLPRLRMGIAHNFGCIRVIKAYPHVSGLVGVSKEDAPLHLGMIALACSDGCVRILNIPDPAHLTSALPSPKKATMSDSKQTTLDAAPLIVEAKKVAALLLPSGMGVEEWTSFGQCLCVDWFPSNQHMRLAAGYYNGYICIWDVCSSPLLNSGSPASSARQQLHPLIQLVGQSEPCRALAWCPHDSNYLVTGGHGKSLSLWDIRQPFSPIDKQDKGFISYEIVWPLLWCHSLLLHDSSASVSHPHGIQHCSYMHSGCNTKQVTANFGPLASMSYSDWSDRVAASSFAGEVSVTSFDSNYHVSVTTKSWLITNTDRHKIVCHCYTKPLESTSDEGSDHPSLETPSCSSMKEKARTHRMVFSRGSPSHLGDGPYQPDNYPLATFTKVCWNSNQQTSAWLLLATNSGLVQLLHLPRH